MATLERVKRLARRAGVGREQIRAAIITPGEGITELEFEGVREFYTTSAEAQESATQRGANVIILVDYEGGGA